MAFMIYYYSTNRIKCAAEINASGRIVIGAAEAHFKAPDADSMNEGAMYLLEDAGGQWEMGVIGTYVTDGWTRAMSEGEINFANSTGSLTLSFVVNDMQLWACNRSSAMAGIPPKASADGAMAAGKQAAALAAYGVAIGTDTVAVYDYEVALGFSPQSDVRSLALSKSVNNTSGTLPMATPYGVACNFGTWQSALTGYADGIYRVQGTVLITDDANAGSAYSKVIDVDYSMWLDSVANTVALIGTTSLTALFTGATVPNSTLSVNATTGALSLASTYVTGVTADAQITVTRIRR